MYLVLTAMLALNVAKEVLNAFVLVDDGLVTTTENFAAKNQGLYSTFAKEYELNPEKVGDWKDKADEVQAKSNELFEFIHSLKIEILSVKEEEAIHGDDIHLDEVKAKDDNNIPAEIMIVKKRGTELKKKIDEHREYLLSLIDDKEKYATTVDALGGILSTELPDLHMEHGGKR